MGYSDGWNHSMSVKHVFQHHILVNRGNGITDGYNGGISVNAPSAAGVAASRGGARSSSCGHPRHASRNGSSAGCLPTPLWPTFRAPAALATQDVVDLPNARHGHGAAQKRCHAAADAKRPGDDGLYDAPDVKGSCPHITQDTPKTVVTAVPDSLGEEANADAT